MGRKILFQKLYLCCVFVLISGCVPRFNTEAISVLKQLSKNQKEIDDYVQIQREGFLRLEQDILREKLYAGLPKQEIISRYGDPIYCSPSAEHEQKLACLYRQPMEFFSVDRIYLYFDADGRLEYWVLKPADNQWGK